MEFVDLFTSKVVEWNIVDGKVIIPALAGSGFEPTLEETPEGNWVCVIASSMGCGFVPGVAVENAIRGAHPTPFHNESLSVEAPPVTATVPPPVAAPVEPPVSVATPAPVATSVDPIAKLKDKFASNMAKQEERLREKAEATAREEERLAREKEQRLSYRREYRLGEAKKQLEELSGPNPPKPDEWHYNRQYGPSGVVESPCPVCGAPPIIKVQHKRVEWTGESYTDPTGRAVDSRPAGYMKAVSVAFGMDANEEFVEANGRSYSYNEARGITQYHDKRSW